MFSTHFVVNWISRDFGSNTSQYFSHWSETSFQKNVIPVFQVWLLTTPVYLKEERFYQQMQNSILNRLEPIRNRENYLPFSFCTLSLSAQFNWNTVFPEFCTLLGVKKLHIKLGRSKKNTSSDKKAFKIISKGKFLEGKERNLFLLYISFMIFACIYLLSLYMFFKIAMSMDLFNLGLK